MFAQEKLQLAQLLEDLQIEANFKPDSLIVLGCSSSEIIGQKIGTASSADAAEALLPVILEWAEKHSLFLAVQGCEHINRSLAISPRAAQMYNLTEVSVVPHRGAGGAMCALAFNTIKDAIMVESLSHKAHGGIDIGSTFIGMHLRHVAVPVRTRHKNIGMAYVTCARTRPPLIGGPRAKYE